MKVLGVSGRDRETAVAVAIDGRVVAAASEDAFGLASATAAAAGAPSEAIASCLSSAGLDLDEIETLSLVEEAQGVRTGLRATTHWIDPLLADAVHATGGRPGAVLVGSEQPASMALVVLDERGGHTRRIVPGGATLVAAAGSLAERLGARNPDPFTALDRISVGGDAEFSDDLERCVEWDRGERAIHVDTERLSQVVERAASGRPVPLSDAGSANVGVHRARRNLAASFLGVVASQVAEAAADLNEPPAPLAFGGSMFASVRLTTELRSALSTAPAVAPVPERAGRALGAALAAGRGGSPAPDAPLGLALGPSFEDADIKRTLDNCRLDYVYEPDWQRIYARTSKMLAQGRVVAWFQGPMAFGPRSFGSRSILCDPSSRYARHNVNEYLRQVPLDEPLPMVFAPSMAESCLVSFVDLPGGVVDAGVRPEWRDRFAGALDAMHRARVQSVMRVQAPQLCDLLECHQHRTGIPALIETTLNEPGRPMACTPRDAVRVVYSSAIDALIVGRFILMKDHWLLRSGDE